MGGLFGLGIAKVLRRIYQAPVFFRAFVMPLRKFKGRKGIANAQKMRTQNICGRAGLNLPKLKL